MLPLPALPEPWSGVFDASYTRERFTALMTWLDAEYREHAVQPAGENLFRALERVAPTACRVVILGQDPYPTPGNAHGLSFSVLPPRKAPASLRTIFKELARTEPGWVTPPDANLDRWAGQGVLMLNRILSVRSGAPMSHAGRGWEEFTEAVLRHVQRSAPFVVFMLWGGKAQSVRALIDTSRHAILETAHPSPMAQNQLPPEKKFVGSGQFAECNRLLAARGLPPVSWLLP